MLWKYVSTVGIYKFLDVTIIRSFFTPKSLNWVQIIIHISLFVDVR
jgi:hypothetical protein